MGLDVSLLKKFDKDVTSRSNHGAKLEYAGKVFKDGDPVTIRLIEPPQSNGVYFQELVQYYFNGKSYTSPSTFGEPCPIEDELKKARALGRPDIDDMCSKVGKPKSFYLIIKLTIENDKPSADGPCIMSCPQSMLFALNKQVIELQAQGIEATDRVAGHNFTITRTGQKLDTRWTVSPKIKATTIEQTDYYLPTKLPNLYNTAINFCNHPDYLRAVVRNYIYGEQVPEGLANLKYKDTKASPAVANPSVRAEQATASVSAAVSGVGSAPTPVRKSVTEELDDFE